MLIGKKEITIGEKRTVQSYNTKGGKGKVSWSGRGGGGGGVKNTGRGGGGGEKSHHLGEVVFSGKGVWGKRTEKRGKGLLARGGKEKEIIPIVK